MIMRPTKMINHGSYGTILTHRPKDNLNVGKFIQKA